MNADSSSLQVLQNSIDIISDETRPLTYQLKPSDIWVFRNESEPDDGWFSQGNLLLHEDHRIVFRKEQHNLAITSILQHVSVNLLNHQNQFVLVVKKQVGNMLMLSQQFYVIRLFWDLA